MSSTTSTNSTAPQDEEYDATGFITYQLSTLPIGLRAIISLLCIVIGLGLCTLSPYAARWGAQWGMKNSDTSIGEESEGERKWRFRLAGGVLGIFTGALGAAYTILLLACAVLSTQDDPSLAPGAILAMSIISAILGSIIGGRWKAMSRLFLTYIGTISLTLLFSVSFRIKRKLGRLIIFIILLIITSITCFVFSIIPNNLNHSSTLKRLSNRISFLLSASTGAWLFCSIGIDLFIKIGLLEGFTLLVSDNGIFKNGPPSSSSDDGDNVDEFVNVVKWNEGKCKGFLAGMWLLIVFGTAFQQWRYSVIGDDPEESWNTYLGSLLSNEKNPLSRARHSDKNNNITNRAGYFSKYESNWFKKLFMTPSEKKRRMMPATYMLPPEQIKPHQEAENQVYDDPYRIQGIHPSPNMEGDNQDMMREIHNGDHEITSERRRNPPARYDSFGYSTIGLGLYDIEGDGRDAYYLPSPHENLRETQRRAQMLPTYHPESYFRENLVLPRNETEPSFQSVPKYSPPRIDYSASHSTSSSFRPYPRGTVYNDTRTGPMNTPSSWTPEGTYTNRLVEEPEESDRLVDSEGQAFIAPLSPQARTLEGNAPKATSSSSMAVRMNKPREEVQTVPIPATPSLVNAIKRVSEAQAQARKYRMQEQQASLSLANQTNQGTTSSSPTSYAVGRLSPNLEGQSTTTNPIPKLPESERIALKQAAIRRQTSADWWAEVERKANEKQQIISNQRISSAPSTKSNTGMMKNWRSSSASNAGC